MKYLALLLILHFLHSINGDPVVGDDEIKRKRSFSIFSVVQFQNNVCFMPVSSSTATPMRGTCFTSSECSSNGGTGSGSCASGFGVCCMFTVSTCGATVSKNTTYIQNPGFPSAFTTVTTNCQYTITTTSDICQIRLDFDNLVLGNPQSANAAAAGAVPATTIGVCSATDQLKVVSQSGSGPNASPPIVCGTLTGQHMYIETGRQSPTGATLTFANAGTAATTPARTWKIRVTQIECGNPLRAPTDCLQYFTGPSGTFSSYNHQNGITGQLLQTQNYNYCFRQEEGYCAIQISETDVTAPAKAFALDAVTVITSKQTTTTCANAELTVISSNTALNTDSFCGTYLNEISGQNRPGTITSITTPFNVGFFSTTTASMMGMAAVGFNLNYNQVPC